MVSNHKLAKPKTVAVVLTALSLSGGTSIIFEFLKKFENSVSLTILLPDPTALRHGNDFANEINQRGYSLAFLSDNKDPFDVVILTFWTTVPAVMHAEIRAKLFVFFLQSLEDRFYADPHAIGELESHAVQEVYGLNLPTITEAGWIWATLGQRNSDPNMVKLLRNPIILENAREKPIENYSGVLPENFVITVEGHASWFKGIKESLEAISLVKDTSLIVNLVGDKHKKFNTRSRLKFVNHEKITRLEFHKLLADSDVLIKMSHVEGLYGPPLEAFSLGTTCITSNVTGSEEFIRHLDNAIVVEIGDSYGLARWIESLAANRPLLSELNKSAKITAREWQDAVKVESFVEFIDGFYENARDVALKLPDFLATERHYWPYLTPRVNNQMKFGTDLQIAFKFGWRLLRKGQIRMLLSKTVKYLKKHYGSSS